MKYLIFVFFLFFCTSCTTEQAKRMDGLVLVDPNTNKRYLLRAKTGDAFHVFEYVQSINGTDTTYTFK